MSNLFSFAKNASSFAQGITVQADAGVDVQEAVSTKETPSVFAAGTGTLSVAKKASLTTNNQLLTIQTDNVDLHGSSAEHGSALSTGDAKIVMGCATAGRGVGLGSKDPEHGQLLISGNEMQTMHSGGLILGGNCGSLVVAGVKERHSNNVNGIVRLLATSLHKKIIDEETKDAYPQNVIVERPEDATVATLEEQPAPAVIEHVEQKEELKVNSEQAEYVVNEAAVARTEEKMMRAEAP